MLLLLYDKYFYPDQIVLKQKYDFIVCTETVEHFSNPIHDFDTIYSLIRQGGLFGIMTSILYGDIAFADWYYRFDPTHVAFYRPETLHWISQRWNWDLLVPKRNVCIFKKNVLFYSTYGKKLKNTPGNNTGVMRFHRKNPSI